MEKVYILSACRTPIGKFGGKLSGLTAVELGAAAIRGVVDKAQMDIKLIDHVYMGCVIQAGLGQNVARQAAVKAGIPYSVPAETLNVVCGSGLETVNMAAHMIKSGEADVIVAGGMESMSNAPYVLEQARFGYRMGNGELIDAMLNDALWDSYDNCHMGITAENIAERWHLSRKELDEFALKSQKKASEAVDNGKFVEEIIPVKITEKKHESIIYEDESIRRGMVIEDLAKLRPAFKTDGIVTAGNSSGINDGAAAVILISGRMLQSLGLKPMAEWIGGDVAGVNPDIMGIGPVASTNKLLKKLNMKIEDIDLIEANEAFAAQSIAVARELHIPEDKLNVNGGAIALGHPVGASGCRILVTLLYEMNRRKVKTGLATLCIGGGMGSSLVVQSIY